jgi:hypothetical protein
MSKLQFCVIIGDHGHYKDSVQSPLTLFAKNIDTLLSIDTVACTKFKYIII